MLWVLLACAVVLQSAAVSDGPEASSLVPVSQGSPLSLGELPLDALLAEDGDEQVAIDPDTSGISHMKASCPSYSSGSALVPLEFNVAPWT